jgi:hypothetical protein
VGDFSRIGWLDDWRQRVKNGVNAIHN